jgi:hypothetical protein
MKKSTAILLGICTAIAISSAARADTSLTAYGTYWDGDDTGKGAGLRLKKTILGFGAVEGRGGYVVFDDTKTDVIPLDVSLNLRLPFMISPYAGIGAGYYITSSDVPGMDNTTGYFGQLGVEATFVWIGAMAELRWHDIEGSYLDGTSFNLGLLVKW